MKRPNRSSRATRSWETGSAEEGSRTSSTPSVRPLSTSGSTSVDVAPRPPGVTTVRPVSQARPAAVPSVRTCAPTVPRQFSVCATISRWPPTGRSTAPASPPTSATASSAIAPSVPASRWSLDDHLLAGGHEDPQLLDALGGRELVGGRRHERGRGGERHLQVALGGAARHDGERLDGEAGGLGIAAAGEQVLVEAATLARRGHEPAEHEMGDRRGRCT